MFVPASSLQLSITLTFSFFHQSLTTFNKLKIMLPNNLGEGFLVYARFIVLFFFTFINDTCDTVWYYSGEAFMKYLFQPRFCFVIDKVCELYINAARRLTQLRDIHVYRVSFITFVVYWDKKSNADLGLPYVFK